MGIIRDIKPVVNQLKELEYNIIDGKGDIKQAKRDIRKLRRKLRKIIKESCKLESGDCYIVDRATENVRKFTNGTYKGSKLSAEWLNILKSQKIFTIVSSIDTKKIIYKFL